MRNPLPLALAAGLLAAPLIAAEAPAEAPEVTYEQVLDRPDDADLNYRFALGQIRRGQVLGASATLERILMKHPELANLRYLHGLVLMRLDNVDAAEAEFKAALAQGAPVDIQAQAQEQLAEIERRRKRTHLDGSLGFGWAYDTNRNASPSSGDRLFGGAPLKLDASGQRRDDTSLQFLGRFGVERDLGTAAGHSLHASVGYYRSEQTLVNLLDLQAWSFRGGARLRLPWFDWVPDATFDHVLLSQSSYLRAWGQTNRLERGLSKRTRAFLQGGYQYQDFMQHPLIGGAEEREGAELTLGGGLEMVLGARQRLTPSLLFSEKWARKVYYEYERYGFALDHALLVGRGMFLLTGLSASYDRYSGIDRLVANFPRRDDTYRLSATYGIPGKILYKRWAKALEPLTWTFSWTYTHALSTITNYAYDNNQVGTLLTYRWRN